MIKIAILDDYQSCAERLADWSRIKAKAELTVFTDSVLDPARLEARLSPFDVVCLMRERTPLPRQLLQKLSKLKLIVLTGRRSQTFDIAAAQEMGIKVAFTGAGPAAHATPELAIGLILALARHIPLGDAMMKRGEWLEHAPLGRVLNGSTLGIIGLGNVGSRVAQFAKLLGMSIKAWSPNLTRDRAEQAGAELAASKEELLRAADVISLHLVLAPSTVGTIGERELAQMKPTALLVNTARGPLVDVSALLKALSERRIAGAALDVYDLEPLPGDHPLRRLDNVVLTPHFGYVTKEIYEVFYRETARAVEEYLEAA